MGKATGTQQDNKRHLRLWRASALVVIAGLLVVVPFLAWGQYYNPEITPPPPSAYPPPPPVNPADSIMLPFPVQQTVPQSYEDLMSDELAYDLANPSNIRTEAEYDPATGCYIVRTKMGDIDIATPFLMTAQQYNDWQLRRSMQQYYRERNLGLITDNEKQPFNIFDMNFALGPLEKIFGPGGVSLKTQGSVQLNMGIKSNFTDNPSLSINSRRKTYFDFDQKIQATIGASVGDRLNFNMTYNTDATFDFDSKT